MSKSVSLKEAVKFHGHLGPYLVIGIRMGEFALKKLRIRKYFGFEVMVKGACLRPKSCLIDGLQISTGATFGKGNIQKRPGKEIEVLIRADKKMLKIKIKKELQDRLNTTMGHKENEHLAGKLFNSADVSIFKTVLI